MKLAIGTAQFGQDYGIANSSGSVKSNEAKLILDFALKNDINTIDTASDYGKSEQILGQSDLSKFNVITKIPSFNNVINVDLWLEERIQSSIKKLGIKTLKGVLLHRPLELFSSNGKAAFNSLVNIREKGFIDQIGISVYSPDEAEIITKKFNIDIIQGPFSLIDRRFEKTGLLKKFKEENIEFHARSIFLQGLLLLSKESLPRKFAKWKNVWKLWDEANENIDSKVNSCLAFAMQNDLITKVVVGIDNLNQLKDIICKAKNSLQYKDYPFLSSDDEMLLHPSNWNKL